MPDNTTHKYTTRVEETSKEKILQRDGIDIFCHKIPPVVFQGHGGPNIMRMPCGTTCGRAEITSNSQGLLTYRQNCETTSCGFQLTQAF